MECHTSAGMAHPAEREAIALTALFFSLLGTDLMLLCLRYVSSTKSLPRTRSPKVYN